MAVADKEVVIVNEREVLSVMSSDEWFTEQEINTRIAVKYCDPEFPAIAPIVIGRALAFLARMVERGQAECRPRPELVSRRLIQHRDLLIEYRLMELSAPSRIVMSGAMSRFVPVAPRYAGRFLFRRNPTRTAAKT